MKLRCAARSCGARARSFARPPARQLAEAAQPSNPEPCRVALHSSLHESRASHHAPPAGPRLCSAAPGRRRLGAALRPGRRELLPLPLLQLQLGRLPPIAGGWVPRPWLALAAVSASEVLGPAPQRQLLLRTPSAGRNLLAAPAHLPGEVRPCLSHACLLWQYALLHTQGCTKGAALAPASYAPGHSLPIRLPRDPGMHPPLRHSQPLVLPARRRGS